MSTPGENCSLMAADMNLVLTLGAHVFITAAFYYSTSLFCREDKDHYKLLRQDFFKDLESPVIADEAQDAYDHQQRDKLGSVVMIMGTGLLLMALIPNALWGRTVFVLCALAVSGIGFLLKRSTRTEPGAASAASPGH